MANKVYINNLNGGMDETASDIFITPGYVRKAHNMYPAIGSGYKRIKGWDQPCTNVPAGQTFTGAPEDDKQQISFFFVGDEIHTLKGTRARDGAGVGLPAEEIVISKAYISNSSENLSGDSVGNRGIWGFEFYYNENLTATIVDYVYEHVINCFAYSFSSQDSEFVGASGQSSQSIAVTFDGDILWAVSGGVHILQSTSATLPSDWWDTYGGGKFFGTSTFAPAADRLWIANYYGVLRFSRVGNPFDFAAGLGVAAGELIFDSEVTNIVEMVDGTVFVSTMNACYILYEVHDTELLTKKQVNAVGAYPGSAQRIGNDVYYLTRYGVTSLSATQKFGNFLGANLTDKLNPLLPQINQNSWLDYEVRTTINIANSLYILQAPSTSVYDQDASDNITVKPAITYLGLVQNKVETDEDPLWSTSDDVPNITRAVHYRNEAYYFAQDGDVFRWMDGFSQDGAEYVSYITTGYDHFGAPYVDKTYRKLMLTTSQETFPDDPSPTLTLDIATSFDDGIHGVPNTSTSTTEVGGSNWSSDAWGEFIWGQADQGVADIHLSGNGQNVSTTISHKSASTKPYVIKTLSYIYENRRVDH